MEEMLNDYEKLRVIFLDTNNKGNHLPSIDRMYKLFLHNYKDIYGHEAIGLLLLRHINLISNKFENGVEQA
jgi:hypothetical protein